MTGWPRNEYLHQWLSSDEGQRYLEVTGSLEAWRQRSMLEPAQHQMLEIVADPAAPEGSLFFIGQPRVGDSPEEAARRSAVITNIDWEF